jgi:hypothetical protein
VINTAVPDEALAQAYLGAEGDGYDVAVVPLSDIVTTWQRTDLRGSRLVVVP